jgi:RNA polymerase sigma-70 factor (ECF subfamily)
VRPDPKDLSDAALLRSDDPDAFAAVYDRHAPKVFAWAAARVGDYAADLTAEVFAQAWRSRGRFADQADGSAGPWLFGIAQNVLRSSVRKRRVEHSARTRLGLPPTVSDEHGYDVVEERLSFPSAVLCAFAQLPESERQVLVLRLVEDRSYKEIALRLHCTPVAARLRVSRSIRRLQLVLGGP